MVADPAVPALRPAVERRPGRTPDGTPPDRRPVVCVDLDSTLCDTRHRQPMLAGITDPSTVDWVACAMAELGVPTTVRPPGEVPVAASPVAAPVATLVAPQAAGTPGTSGV